MRVLFCGSGWLPVVDAIRARIPDETQVSIRDPDRDIFAQLEDVQVILPSNMRIKAEHIQAAKSLRLIQQPAVGHNGIDKEAAAAGSIPVCNAPGTNGQAVAETAFFLMLALAKQFNQARDGFLRPTLGEPAGMELSGKTLGIIGRGESGSRVRRIAEAMGMQTVVIHSTSGRTALLEMLGQADLVTIHCPLSKETRDLIDAEALAAMKEGACLINCARGPIVNRAALEASLEKLGGVGLDVFWREPWDPDEPLFSHPKVVTLPHVGGSTREAFGRIADIVVENMRRLDSGEPLLHRVA